MDEPTKVMSLCRLLLLCALSFATGGCLLEPVSPDAPWATKVEAAQATDDYWFARPATAHVDAADYDALWNACERTMRDFSFSIERNDYRIGLMTSKPLVSRQFFEFWKHDVVDPASQVDSDVATRRRVLRFIIRKIDDRQFVCEPKVVVEHYEMVERRITAVTQYQDAFSNRRALEEETIDEGQAVHPEYWYAERRDGALEAAIAERLQRYVSTSR